LTQTQKKPGSFEQNFPANYKLSEKFSVVIFLNAIALFNSIRIINRNKLIFKQIYS